MTENLPSRRDNAVELCYILVTNSAICSTDDRETTDGKIAHLEEVFEVAEEWLWNARAHQNSLKFPSRFKKGDLVRVPKESSIGRYDVGKVLKVESCPDTYRYTVSIHKTFWRRAVAEGTDEDRFRPVRVWEDELLPPNEGTTSADLTPKKYRAVGTVREKKEGLPKPKISAEKQAAFMKELMG